jgi:hypothetical protein
VEAASNELVQEFLSMLGFQEETENTKVTEAVEK